MNLRIDLDAVRAGGHAFLIWWLGELAEALATLPWRPWRNWRSQLLLECRGENLVASRVKGREAQELGVLPLGAAGDGAAEALRRRLRGRTVTLRLPAGQGLRRQVMLPAAAKDKLRQILSFEMDRLTPWPADAVYFGAEIIERRDASAQINVQLTVLPRAVVDPLVARLAGWKMAPAALELDGPASTGASRVPLAGGAARPPRRPALQLGVALLAGEWLLASGFGYVQERRLDALRQQLEQARREAQAVGRLRDEVARLSDKDSFLSKLRRDSAPLVLLVDVLSQALPDNSWLFELHLSQKEVALSGFAKDASALVPLIEQSHAFTDVKFQAPVLRDPGLNAERFQIGANLRPPAELRK